VRNRPRTRPGGVRARAHGVGRKERSREPKRSRAVRGGGSTVQNRQLSA